MRTMPFLQVLSVHHTRLTVNMQGLWLVLIACGSLPITIQGTPQGGASYGTVTDTCTSHQCSDIQSKMEEVKTSLESTMEEVKARLEQLDAKIQFIIEGGLYA